jgi:hypothetical protein
MKNTLSERRLSDAVCVALAYITGNVMVAKQLVRSDSMKAKPTDAVYAGHCGPEDARDMSNPKWDAYRKKVLARTRAWQKATSEHEAEAKKKWYEANRDLVIERRRKYRLNNGTRLAEEQRKYDHANLQTQRAKARERMTKTRLPTCKIWATTVFTRRSPRPHGRE